MTFDNYPPFIEMVKAYFTRCSQENYLVISQKEPTQELLDLRRSAKRNQNFLHSQNPKLWPNYTPETIYYVEEFPNGDLRPKRLLDIEQGYEVKCSLGLFLYAPLFNREVVKPIPVQKTVDRLLPSLLPLFREHRFNLPALTRLGLSLSEREIKTGTNIDISL